MRRGEFFAACAAGAAEVATLGVAAAEPEPKFAFRAPYWTNLHHRLYRHVELREKRRRGWYFRPGEAQVLERYERIPAGDEVAWRSALAIYAREYSRRDLLFDPDMGAIDRTLIDAPDDASLPRGLPAPLVQALTLASPVYRGALWQADHGADTDWIAETVPNLARYGARFRRDLPRWFGTPWAPRPYDVAVMYDANWAGLYSDYGSSYANIFASSGPHGAHDLSGVEMLFHEAAHSLVEPDRGPVAVAIQAASARAHRTVPEDLWHVLIFATTGLLAENVFRAAGRPYTMYMVAQGLYDRGGWEFYRRPVETYWPRYLEGRDTMQEAIRSIIADLPR